MCRCCTVAYDFILVIVVTSLFCYSHFHTLTLLGGLYQMFLDSAAVYIMLCCCVQKRLVLILNCCYIDISGVVGV